MDSRTFDVGVIIGSSRPDSRNQRVYRAMRRIAPPELRLNEIVIADLPMFEQALAESAYPERCMRFRDEVIAADGLLFLTPEHNRSIPAVLKNAIDWGSRPYGQSAWLGKVAALTGASYGRIGTAAAQQHLRSILGCLDVLMMGLPEVFIYEWEGLIDAEHNVTDPETRAIWVGFLESFVKLLQRVKPLQ